MAILGELDRASLLDTSVPTVYTPSLGEALKTWDIAQSQDVAVQEFFRAGPAGIRTTKAFSQSCRYDELDTDREKGCIRSKANRSEEHTSELQSLMRISYAVFCLKKKKDNNI